MLDTAVPVRPLLVDDLPALRELSDRDPWSNLFVRARLDHAGIDPRWFAGQMLGYFAGDDLVSACHLGANVVPVEATDEAVEAFGRHLAQQRRPASIVGRAEAVLALWRILEPVWGPARSPRPDQPFMVIDTDSDVAPDPRVRRFTIDEVDTLYPASIAMFREEVGVDPDVDGGYRARVAQQIAQGWAFGVVHEGSVLFKAEIGAAAGSACQLQGVYVRPDLRGRGVAAPALAAVVAEVRRSIAPEVTLYVNSHNVAARRAYERVGFRQVATFASILM